MLSVLYFFFYHYYFEGCILKSIWIQPRCSARLTAWILYLSEVFVVTSGLNVEGVARRACASAPRTYSSVVICRDAGERHTAVWGREDCEAVLALAKHFLQRRPAPCAHLKVGASHCTCTQQIFVFLLVDFNMYSEA